MRGGDVRTENLFSYLSCEARVPADHPLRPIRTIVDQALTVLSPAFDRLYSDIGRPSIPPEKLLRTLLLQAFYSVRSERQLMEQVDYNLLFRWFVGLAMDAPIWDVTVVHQEPRPVPGGRGRRAGLPGGPRPARGQGTALGRALLGRWHPDRGLGQHEELQAESRSWRRAAGGRRWRTQRRARLPRRAPAQRHARLVHRSRCPAIPQRRGAPGRPPEVAPGSQPRARRPSFATWATC